MSSIDHEARLSEFPYFLALGQYSLPATWYFDFKSFGGKFALLGS